MAQVCARSRQPEKSVTHPEVDRPWTMPADFRESISSIGTLNISDAVAA